MRSEGYVSFVCYPNLTYRPTNDTTYLTGNEGLRFSLRCRARELSACASRPFFIKMRMRIELYKRVQIYKGLKNYEAILLKRLRLA